MLILGDLHGEVKRFIQLCLEHPKETVIQVGDLGLGFGVGPHYPRFFIPENGIFIRGNHDNPAECRTYPNYMGDWGIRDNMFFMGGGHSIDRSMRVQGIDWWPDEEICEPELTKIRDAYLKAKPEIMITHECPASVMYQFFGIRMVYGHTSHFLDQLWKAHQPLIWVFGHHHKYVNQIVNGTKFICADINQAIEL